MSYASFPTNIGVPNSGLASRRGGQALAPLSFDAVKLGTDQEKVAATPRTSRSHLLAGLRTAPKSTTAATFPPSPTAFSSSQASRTSSTTTVLSLPNNPLDGPKTSLPKLAQMQTYNDRKPPSTTTSNARAASPSASVNTTLAYSQQHYTADQILAPPEIQVDEQDLTNLGSEYAELVATNMYLAAQKQHLQQQLMSVQAAQQQFQNMGFSASSGHQSMQQAAFQQLVYQQQQQHQHQKQVVSSSMTAPGSIYTVVDPMTGQQSMYMGQAAQLSNHFVDQYNSNLQQLQHLQLLQQQLQQQQRQEPQQAQVQYQHQYRQTSPVAAPRVHVSSPESHGRNSSPRCSNSPSDQPTPLPPPSVNAFRRGHKKSVSLVNSTVSVLATDSSPLPFEPPKSAGPKTTSFSPSNAQAATYGPGHGRAGEHPVRQPRGPPSFDELAQKPTSKHEGSKNFAARTRRSAVHNLMRAGITRRQVTVGGSSGSISPISENAEELAAPLTDDESVSGRSGSGSLNGDDVECSLPSSRTSTGSWGAIGSERPSSREKQAYKSVESLHSHIENPDGTFASVFKSAVPMAVGDGHRKSPMLVLTNGEKSRFSTVI